ncbi:hypothetical protein C8F04DRAFT_1274289 [Mycena alexandri]|uniref:Uncharacterized protein n=1 Tax=Mycena alexandri TaxID=1745969 RepID=A0AAD6S4J5_9AGAR|nr:hypothetical protein C8F04DRAFT_1274289 [Mycena alexandri]
MPRVSSSWILLTDGSIDNPSDQSTRTFRPGHKRPSPGRKTSGAFSFQHDVDVILKTLKPQSYLRTGKQPSLTLFALSISVLNTHGVGSCLEIKMLRIFPAHDEVRKSPATVAAEISWVRSVMGHAATTAFDHTTALASTPAAPYRPCAKLDSVTAADAELAEAEAEAEADETLPALQEDYEDEDEDSADAFMSTFDPGARRARGGVGEGGDAEDDVEAETETEGEEVVEGVEGESEGEDAVLYHGPHSEGLAGGSSIGKDGYRESQGCHTPRVLVVFQGVVMLIMILGVGERDERGGGGGG